MSSRRTFLRQSTAMAALAATSSAPWLAHAAGKPVKIGVLHPVTGALVDVQGTGQVAKF